jgi:hypothetical protein
MRRRDFITTSTASAIALACPRFAPAAAAQPVKTTQPEPEGFFTLGKVGERWVFLTPERRPFFSMGLNHIDPSPLMYPENRERWEQKYGNDTLEWIRKTVAPDLKSFGFNSVGWVQEVTVKKQAHTPSFTLEEYRALGMPYCHLLPFIETHQWNPWHKNPDLMSKDFADWCDFVARSQCTRLRDEKNLIGYFYSDCPTWVHTRPDTEWRGPMFDPDKLKSAAGRKELFNLARHYYRVTHDAIRRYDPHHLILGDRYEANAPLPLPIVNAADPYVDVLSFQDFRDPVTHMLEWYEKTGKPVLWADGSRSRQVVKDDTGKHAGGQYHLVNGRWYADVLHGLTQNPGAIGAHLCGAYIRNRSRSKGLIDEQERHDEVAIEAIQKGHRAVERWVTSLSP